MVRLMVTNGGAHPADKWADVTVETILDLVKIADDAVSPEAFAARQAKRDLAPKLFVIMHRHHSDVQDHHRSKLKKLQTSQLLETINVTIHMSTAKEVLDLLATTPFAAHFARPEVAEVIRQIIGQHTADVIHIERCWHADALAAKGA